MAEALVAIGLAANIVQFVCFSFTLVSKTKDLQQSSSGALSENIELSVISQDIMTFSRNMSSNRSSSTQLSIIKKHCEAIAGELLAAIDKLQHKQQTSGVGKSPTRWRSFRKALKYVWDKPHIDELKGRLERLRDQMMMHLVSDTRDNQAQLLDLLEDWKKKNIQANYGFTAQIQNLDKQLQTTSKGVSDLHGDIFWKRLDECLSQLSLKVHQVSRCHMIVASLRYDCMQMRQSAIGDAHQKTFEWMYGRETSDMSVSPRASTGFTQWLQCGSGTYWITGKPGSGKSTLMKYLYDHCETIRSLQVWSGDAPLVRACFYFWLPGQQMQKSLEGLLQTLLYHILHACPELAPTMCPERWDAESPLLSNYIASRMSWTLPELRRSLKLFQTQANVTTKFYFQVDGLDEYYGDSWEVVDTLRDLSATANVKLCVSSRPWNCFQNSFGKANPNTIRLHEFTRSDIELFARENLQSHRVCTDFEPSLFDDLVREIGERAQGVFLWVRLVVRSLCNGIENEDPTSILQQRLRKIPSDLEDFFDQIIRSVDGVYRKRMASTFLAAMSSPHQLNLMNYYFLEQENSAFALDVPSKRWRYSAIQRRAHQTERRLNGRFKGLLEATPTAELSAQTKVDFLHRTLNDFLATKRMREKLRAWASGELNVSTAISRALIAESKFIVESSPASIYKLAVELARKGVQETGNIAHAFALYDQAESENERMRSSHSKCGLNCYILRHVASLGHPRYLRYRVHRDGDSLDLNCILKHAIACPVASDETDSSCLPSAQAQHRMAGLSTDWYTSSFSGPVANVPLPFLVKVLFELGADPNAVVDQTSSWYALAGEATRLMDGKHQEQYWAVLELFLKKGVDVNMATENWIEILNRTDTGSEHGLRNTLRHVGYLFRYGLNPNILRQGTTMTTDLFKMLIRNAGIASMRVPGIPPVHDAVPRLQLELLREFLRRGADVSVIFCDRASVGWFTNFCEQLSRTKIGELFTLIGQYRVLLQHGLDPNGLTSGGRTLWEILLDAVLLGTEQANYTSQNHEEVHAMFLTSLQYGADPHIDEVQKVLLWMEISHSKLSNSRLDLVKRVLQAEIDHRRNQTLSQHSVYMEPGGTRSSRHVRPTMGHRMAQRGKRDHEHASHDEHCIDSKRPRLV